MDRAVFLSRVAAPSALILNSLLFKYWTKWLASKIVINKLNFMYNCVEESKSCIFSLPCPILRVTAATKR